MPDRLSILVDHAEPVQLGQVTGSGLATIRRIQDGVPLEAVVDLLSVSPLPGYTGRCRAAVAEHLPPDGVVQVLGSGIGNGPFQELSVVEVLIAADRTLSEELLRRGWARPGVERFASHLRHEELVAALREARQTRAGYWGEVDATAAGQLDMGLAARTTPVAQPPEWFGHVGAVFLLVFLLVIAGIGYRNRDEEGRIRKKRGWWGRTQRLLLGMPAVAQAALPDRRRPPAPKEANDASGR